MGHQISCIYKISCTNDKYYIGSTIDYNKRKNRHLAELYNNRHHNNYLQNIYNKYGKDSLLFEILSELPKESLFEAETNIIIDNIKNENCINILASSTWGDTLSNHPNKSEIILKRSLSFHKLVNSLTSEERKSMFGRYGKQNGSYRKEYDDASREISRKHGLIGGETRKKQTKNKTFDEIYGTEKAVEMKRKLSNTMKEIYSDPKKNQFYGKKHTESSKNINRKKHIGIFNKAQAKPTSINGVIYLSVTHASKIIGVCTTTIMFRIKSKNFNEYNYIEPSKTKDILDNYKIYDTTNIYK